VQYSYYFLHGLDSSGKGTKGRFFSSNYPAVHCPDFQGNLENRLQQLSLLCGKQSELIFIGSSFGGLMATVFASLHPHLVKRLILLAPALNFPDFSLPKEQVEAKTYLVIGKYDDVTPIDPVLDLATRTFRNLTVTEVEDDHFLHKTFQHLDWQDLLRP